MVSDLEFLFVCICNCAKIFPMQISTNIKKAIGILIILAGCYLVFNEIRKNNDVSDLGKIATTTDSNLPISIDGDGDYTVEEITENNIPIPDLNRPISFGSNSSYDENAKKIIIDKILGLQADLKKDGTDLAKWIDLGLYQKIIGDYDGAVLYWKYVGDVANSDYIAFGNLGDLYAYYLKDKQTAEMYYRKAITNAPTQSYLYIQLAGVYKDVFKDLSKANGIIDEGLRKVPNDPALVQFKSSLQ